jgi:hypothetical protein
MNFTKITKSIKLFFLASIICFIANPTLAESFTINLKGQEIEKLSTIEIKLAFDPYKETLLDEDIKIECNVLVPPCDQNALQKKILYQVADVDNALLRIFFSESPNFNELLIKGSYQHPNYADTVKASIISSAFISDFDKNVNLSKITATINLDTSLNSLPFAGISRADILGPKEKIFNKTIPINIGNLEVYGFSLEKPLSGIFINDQKARLIDGKIITANIIPSQEEIDEEELEVNLTIYLGSNKISKKIGTLKIIESL